MIKPRFMYMCGVDWQEELTQAPDLEGRAPMYSTIAELKKRRVCWKSCGIVKIKMTLDKWSKKQDLFKREE